MTAERSRYTPAALDDLKGRYPLVFHFLAGGELVAADSWTAACREIVPDYASCDPQDFTDQFVKRGLYALRLQVQLQAVINNHFDLATLPAPDREILEGDWSINQPAIDTWTCPVPLVLVDFTDYAPRGDLPRPIGVPDNDISRLGENLVWIDAGDETSLLLSMKRAGVVAVHQNLYPAAHPAR